MKQKYVKRQIESVVKSYSAQFPVVVVTGPRQAGKTTMLKHLSAGKCSYSSFDDLTTRKMAEDDPVFFIKNLVKPAIIDEIQYVPEILPQVKIEADADPDKKGVFFLTGSQQFSLMKGVSESLAGRAGIINMLQFSAVEAAKLYSDNPLEEFMFFCGRGAYPRPALDRSVVPSDWYESYVNLYVEKDVRSLYNIGSVSDFGSFVKVLASRAGQILNLSGIAAPLGVSVNTIKSWISVLETGGIIILLRPWHANTGKRLLKSPKVYFTDTGLLCHLNGLDSGERVKKSPMFGQIFENFCIMEVMKDRINRGIRPGIYYYRDGNGLEVDLLLETQDGLIFAEFKASAGIRSDMTSGLRKLKRIMAKNPPASTYLVSFNDKKMPFTDGVTAAPLKQMLRAIPAK